MVSGTLDDLIAKGVQSNLHAGYGIGMAPAGSLGGGAGGLGKSGLAAKASVAAKLTLPESYLLTHCELLLASLDKGMSKLVLKNLPSVVRLLRPIFLSRSAAVCKIFRELVCRIAQIVSVREPSAEFLECNFYGKLKEEIEGSLENGKLYLGQTAQLSPAVLFSLQLIEDLSRTVPLWLDSHGTSLTRVTQRLLAEHITRSAKMTRAEQGTGDSDTDHLLLNLQPTSSASVFLEGSQALHSGAAVNGAAPGTHVPHGRTAFGLGSGPAKEAHHELTLALTLLLEGLHNGLLEQYVPPSLCVSVLLCSLRTSSFSTLAH